MGRVSILILLGTALVLSLAGQPAPKKATTKASAPSNNAAKTKKAAWGAKGKSTRPVTTRLVRSKSGRLVRVAVHAPPPPSYQTHPDPERYTEIQKALADRGYFKGEANGQWGDDSVDALRRFQAGSNLPDDGKISALTLNGLGLGSRHDGSSASTVPLPTAMTPPPSASTTTVTNSTVGPAASTPAAPTTQPPPL